MAPGNGPLENDFPLQPRGFQVPCGSLPFRVKPGEEERRKAKTDQHLPDPFCVGIEGFWAPGADRKSKQSHDGHTARNHTVHEKGARGHSSRQACS